MKSQLTIPETSQLLGLEESTIESIVSRDDADLAPYIEKIYENASSQVKKVAINLDGLPILIKKLSYNIQTADIIENLACQILHLEILKQENEQLKQENQNLRQELDEFKAQFSEQEKNVPSQSGVLRDTIRKLRWFGERKVEGGKRN